jgi:large subunit ribosomal protein L9
MKIILTHEVSGLGAAGDVVDVKDGYARNYLIPRGFAIRWTKGGEKDVEQIRRARKIHEIQTIEQANEIKARLEGVKVRLAVRSGDAGRLFGSVTPADVASAIKASGGPEVDKRRIELVRRSRRWALTRRPCVCTPRLPPRSTSRSSPRNAAPVEAVRWGRILKGAAPHVCRSLRTGAPLGGLVVSRETERSCCTVNGAER